MFHLKLTHFDIRSGFEGSGVLCPDQWIRKVSRLKEFGFNGILIEFYDHFPYSSLPVKLSDRVWSRDDIERLRKECRKYKMEIVPVLQCFAHAGYLLRHEALRQFAETPDSIIDNAQYCPSNPELSTLWQGMLDELLQAFPETRYFHIGGDEARQLGRCSVCSEKVKETGLSAFVVRHLNIMASYVIKRGIIPVVWSDLLCQYPEAVSELSRDIVVCYWDYFGMRRIDDKVFVREKTHFKQFISRSVLEQETEPSFQTIFRPFWKPQPDESQKINTFFYLDWLEHLGFKTWICPAANASGDNPWYPQHPQVIKNILALSAYGRKIGSKGAVLSLWRGSLWDTSWMLIWIGAKAFNEDLSEDNFNELTGSYAAEILNTSPDVAYAMVEAATPYSVLHGRPDQIRIHQCEKGQRYFEPLFPPSEQVGRWTREFLEKEQRLSAAFKTWHPREAVFQREKEAWLLGLKESALFAGVLQTVSEKSYPLGINELIREFQEVSNLFYEFYRPILLPQTVNYHWWIHFSKVVYLLSKTDCPAPGFIPDSARAFWLKNRKGSEVK